MNVEEQGQDLIRKFHLIVNDDNHLSVRNIEKATESAKLAVSYIITQCATDYAISYWNQVLTYINKLCEQSYSEDNE